MPGRGATVGNVADDLGYFGPHSVTWRLHADPVLWVGGLRALFLQALHPLAMAGVEEHSGFRRDPWGRLFRTAEFVGVTSYGTRGEADRAAARVRLRHSHYTGVEPESGRPYQVADPDLLLWVHCCLVDSFLTTARRAGLRLTASEADRYVAEQVRSATLAGIPVELPPRSVTELDGYFTRMRPELRLTAAARAAARFVLLPPMPLTTQLLTPARPIWAGVAGLAFSLQPAWARRLYRLPGLPATDLGATLGLRWLRLAIRALPPTLREGPNYKRAKARLAETTVRRLDVV
ncbi:MAG: hypothetical protein V7637_3285 [Mycobacteriales bacterium]